LNVFFLVHGMIGMGKTALYFEDILFLAILNAMEGGEDDMTAKIITRTVLADWKGSLRVKTDARGCLFFFRRAGCAWRVVRAPDTG
jgi:hypothetical protein